MEVILSSTNDNQWDQLSGYLAEQNKTNEAMQKAARAGSQSVLSAIVEEVVGRACEYIAKKSGASKPAASVVKTVAKKVTAIIFKVFGW